MNCSYVYTDKTNGRKTSCSHPTYLNTDRCVFHSPAIGRKEAAFAEALTKLLADAEASPKLADLDFKGFIFPMVDFCNRVFRGEADFRGAVFERDVLFRAARFLQQADFHTAEFRGRTDFHAAQFATAARFLGVKFGGRATFNGVKFQGRTVFHGCKFMDFAAWQAANFQTPAVFQFDTFEHDADFRHAVFHRGVDLHKTAFKKRTLFQGARFHDEVVLTETQFGLLKNFRCSRANMNGAVLHTAQIWENQDLRQYSFRDAFLISVNLGGKTFLDCDFTGAVFKAVLTVGWRLDQRTIVNTKFIYTDYRSTEASTPEGDKERLYSPVLSSRVPAVGNFGEGENASFTLANFGRDQLRSPASDVYVSYAWGEDETTEGRQREEIVDRLCQVMETSGRKIVRDKERVKAGDSIERFALEMSKASHIIAVISKQSLNSPYCMAHELFRAFRRCDYRRDEFQKKVIALVMDDAKPILEDHLAMIRLAKTWQAKYEELQRELAAVDPKRTSPDLWVFVDMMGEMYPRLPGMLDAIKDVVMKRGFNEIMADGFREVLNRI
jgi:uncharacterized protein YjbI with pentapeptide repeats